MLFFFFFYKVWGGEERDNRRKLKEEREFVYVCVWWGGRARDEGMNKQTWGGGTEVLFLRGAAGVLQSFELGPPLEAR